MEKLSLSRGSGSIPPTPHQPGPASSDRISWPGDELEGRAKSGQIALDTAWARIRQQSGVISQLQSQVASGKEAQEHAEEELLCVSRHLAQVKEGSERGESVRAELEELRRRHEMALVIIGERNERVGHTLLQLRIDRLTTHHSCCSAGWVGVQAEELEADMADVKSLYREQINLLVSKVDPEQWPQGYRICLFCSHCAQVQSSNKRGGGEMTPCTSPCRRLEVF